jgi:transposase
VVCRERPQFHTIGLEAGPLSQWLHAGLTAAGLAAILIETRHVKAALGAMKVKTVRNDARGMAQLMRTGWLRPVHVKTVPAQEIRALLIGTETTADQSGHPMLEPITAAMLQARASLRAEHAKLYRMLLRIVRVDAVVGDL